MLWPGFWGGQAPSTKLLGGGQWPPGSYSTVWCGLNIMRYNSNTVGGYLKQGYEVLAFKMEYKQAAKTTKAKCSLRL